MKQIGKNSYIFSGTDFDPENTTTIRNIKVSGDVMSLQWIVNAPDNGTVTGVVVLDSGSTDENSEAFTSNFMYNALSYDKPFPDSWTLANCIIY